jgi:hypothetical protein
MEIKKMTVLLKPKRKNEPKKYSTKVYIFHERENIITNLIERHKRPFLVYKKELVPLILQKLEKEHKLVFDTIKGQNWEWSKNCGCSMCPCSPGFIIDNGYVTDIFVTI